MNKRQTDPKQRNVVFKRQGERRSFKDANVIKDQNSKMFQTRQKVLNAVPDPRLDPLLGSKKTINNITGSTDKTVIDNIYEISFFKKHNKVGN